MTSDSATFVGPPGRILVVDDDAAIRTFVGRALAVRGYEAMSAVHGDDALARLRSAPFDVALVDLDMPVRSGLEMLTAIVEEKLEVVPVLMTGTRDVQAAVTAMQRGAFDYIPKPIEPGPLYLVVERAVREAVSRRPACPFDLSPRERELLDLLVHGHTHSEIAEKLFLSVKTVETYKARLKEKTGLRTRSSLVAFGQSLRRRPALAE